MNFTTIKGYDQPLQDVQYRITSIEEQESALLLVVKEVAAVGGFS